MKTLSAFLFCLLLTSSAHTGMRPSPALIAGTQATASANGFVGTKNITTASLGYGGTSSTYFSTFSATTSGDVLYIYYDTQDTALLNLAVTKAAIYDSGGSLLATSTGCMGATMTGTLQRWKLDAAVTITAGTDYQLAILTGDADWQRNRCAFVGKIQQDNTLLGLNVCPASAEASITADTLITGFGTLPIWASNIDNDTH